MKVVYRAIAASTVALTLAGGIAIAQDHGDQDHHDQSHYVRHNDWKKGSHIQKDDWNRGEQAADWRAHQLHKPPKGYEWRMIDGQYVCANSEGVVFQVVAPRH